MVWIQLMYLHMKLVKILFILLSWNMISILWIIKEICCIINMYSYVNIIMMLINQCLMGQYL